MNLLAGYLHLLTNEGDSAALASKLAALGTGAALAGIVWFVARLTGRLE